MGEETRECACNIYIVNASTAQQNLHCAPPAAQCCWQPGSGVIMSIKMQAGSISATDHNTTVLFARAHAFRAHSQQPSWLLFRSSSTQALD
eukprot:1153412-Pelagomonas_calceolata.AAC.10